MDAFLYAMDGEDENIMASFTFTEEDDAKKYEYRAKHNRQDYPARDVKCHKCSKQGHFAKWCRARKEVNGVNEVEVADGSSSDSEEFQGKITPKVTETVDSSRCC